MHSCLRAEMQTPVESGRNQRSRSSNKHWPRRFDGLHFQYNGMKNDLQRDSLWCMHLDEIVGNSSES